MSANIRHSSTTVEWYSPREVTDPARALLGGRIELDPASCDVANRVVAADRIFTVEDDGLSKIWISPALFLNAPGGKQANKSLQNLFWQKLARAWLARQVTQAIFVCFSVELLQVSQGYGDDLPIPLDFPLCYPSARVPYIKATETPQAPLFGTPADVKVEEGEAPPHASVIVFLPPPGNQALGLKGFQARVGSTEKFQSTFSSLGRCVWTREGW